MADSGAFGIRDRGHDVAGGDEVVLAMALFARLDAAGIGWCVVGDVDDLDASVRSDIDIVVDPAALPRIPALLDGFARATGGAPVQALRHEATACWYALAWMRPGAEGAGPLLLHPDVCGDWWRGGRRLLPADEVLTGRVRDPRGFIRPLPARNALYYLLKRLHKGDLGARHIEVVRREWNVDPGAARRIASRWLPSARVDAIEAACDTGDFADILAALPSWRRTIDGLFRASPIERVRETARRLGRALRPTGVLVEVAAPLRDADAEAFLNRWRRAFRLHARWRGRGVAGSAQLARALACSTLLLAQGERDCAQPRLSPGGTRIRIPAAMWGTPAADRALYELLARRTRARLGLREMLGATDLAAPV